MKKFLNILLTIIMIGAIVLLCINLSIRTMSTKTVTNAVISQEASGGIKEVLSGAFPEVSNENINKIETVIKNNDALNDIADSLLKQVKELVDRGVPIDTGDISAKLSQALDKSIPEIEEAIGKKISSKQKEKIQSKLTGEDSALQNKIKSTVEKIETATPKTKQFIKTYDMLSDTFTRVICVGVIIVIAVLLGIINKSYFKWTLFSGIGSLVSGLIVGLFMPLVVEAMEFTIGMRILGMSIDIPVGSLNMAGLVCGAIGIILLVVYLVLKRRYPAYNRHYY